MTYLPPPAIETEAVDLDPRPRKAGRIVAALAGAAVLFGGAFAAIHLVETFTNPPVVAQEPPPEVADEPPPSPTPEPEPEPELPLIHQTTTTQAANIRGGPSQNAGLIGSAPSGATVDITGAPEGGWYPVNYAGQAGWIWGDLLANPQIPTEPIDPGAASEAPTAAVVRQASNVRAGPGNGNRIVTTVAAGVEIEITGTPVEGWFPVRVNDTDGWIWGALLALP